MHVRKLTVLQFKERWRWYFIFTVIELFRQLLFIHMISKMIIINLLFTCHHVNLSINSKNFCWQKENYSLVNYICFQTMQYFFKLFCQYLFFCILSENVCTKNMMKGVWVFPMLPSVDFVHNNLQRKNKGFLLFPLLYSLHLLFFRFFIKYEWLVLIITAQTCIIISTLRTHTEFILVS